MTTDRRSAGLHRLARCASRTIPRSRSSTRRTRCPASGRCRRRIILAAHIPGAVFFDVNAIADPQRSAAAYVSGRRAIRARCRCARHFLGRYRGGLRFRRLGRRAAGVVDVPVVRPCQREGAGRRPEEMDGRRPPDGFRRGHAKAREIPGQARSGLRPQQGSNCSAISKPGKEQLVDARPRPRFEGTVAEPWPGRRSGHIPGSRNVPYAELFDARTGAMKPLDELRKAFAAAGVDTGKTDRDHLRLRRLGAGVDAGAVSPRRARHCAL